MIAIQGFKPRQELLTALNEVTARLAAKDSTLWGPAAQAEASIRLNWIDLPEASRDLLPTLCLLYTSPSPRD